MDAVYLVGPQRFAGEMLRHSLRSLVNLPQVTRVVIAGYRHRWLGDVLHIPVEQQRTKHESTDANLRAALRDDRVSDQFLLMNDDFFVMEPVAEVPVVHRGPLVDQIANHERTNNKTMLSRRRQHLEMLAELGVDDPLCYELHVPMPVDRTAMAEALERADKVRPPKMAPTGKRTLYGNLAGAGGELAEDVKVRTGRDGMPPGPFVSTSSSSWVGRTGTLIKLRFREPSPFERRR